MSQKIHALARVSKFTLQKILRVIMRAVITSQFFYHPLALTCHNRTLSKKIKKLLEGAFQLIYDDRQSTFEQKVSYYLPEKFAETCYRTVQRTSL